MSQSNIPVPIAEGFPDMFYLVALPRYSILDYESAFYPNSLIPANYHNFVPEELILCLKLLAIQYIRLLKLFVPVNGIDTFRHCP
ncbi:MAG: hypothetical protein BWX46_00734 [Candidatus Cloacimonetes bacterium ADurb.Bin003]|nr:MAG: hypothetical protein BWX46_00734 [Candidatus Cloacimonetes bacterium ADurb.Bin003]